MAAGLDALLTQKSRSLFISQILKYQTCGWLKPEVACWFPNSRQLCYTQGASTQAVLMQIVA